MPTEIRDAYAVFDWIVSRHVHGCLDVAGRPVGEGRSTAFQEAATEMRTCPYPGSRNQHPKPMNASAIQSMPPWRELLTLMAWLGYRHRQRYGQGVTRSDDLARITSAGIMLADYLALRRDNPVGSGQVPLVASGVYKVCLGYQLAYLPERFLGPLDQLTLPDAEGFLEYLEQSGLLIGEEEVCSCPPALIVQSYEAMTQAATGVCAPRIDEFSIDWDRFDDFAEAAGEMWREVILFAIQMPTWIPRLDDLGLPGAIGYRLNAFVAEHAAQLLSEREGLVVEVAESVRDALPAPVLAPQGFMVLTSGDLEAGSLAATIMQWLHAKAPQEIAAHGPAVRSALRRQIAAYEAYERGVLRRINGNLNIVMKALDLPAAPALTSTDLSRICGRSLRDWTASAAPTSHA